MIAAIDPHVAAEFASNHPLETAVVRLRSAVITDWRTRLINDCVVGTVTAHKVELERWTPYFGNSFRPVFKGHFIEHAHHVVLSGEFAIARSIRIAMTVWFTFIALATSLGAILTALGRNGASSDPIADSLFFVVAGALFLFAGILLATVGWWLSRKDIAVLSIAIRQALT